MTARKVARTPEGCAGAAAAEGEMGGPHCCPLYHEAVELIGRRWTGAIVEVLLQGGPMRFSEVAQARPGRVVPGQPMQGQQYAQSMMGNAPVVTSPPDPLLN